MLLDAKAKVNAVNAEDNTALHIALANNAPIKVWRR
jgi:ankyrin repeat protein